jgi:uncharacterized coiled-coil protein SlyX
MVPTDNINPTCPFCIGGADVREVLPDPNGDGWNKVVHCKLCGAWVPLETWGHRPGEVELLETINSYQRDIDELDDLLADDESNIKDKDKEIAILENKVASLEGDVFDLRNDVSYYKDMEKEARDTISDRESEIRDLSREVADLQGRIDG